MKRLLMKSLVVLVLAIGIGNYLIYLKTGQMPVLAMRDKIDSNGFGDLFQSFSVDNIAAEARAAADKMVNQFSTVEQASDTKVYKWADAAGRVHFSDKPLVQNAEQIEVDTRNAISAPESSSWPKPKVLAEDKVANEPSPLEKARAAAEAMNARATQQEQSY
jgi:hypothetical protein